jgi:hypothetical protein
MGTATSKRWLDPRSAGPVSWLEPAQTPQDDREGPVGGVLPAFRIWFCEGGGGDFGGDQPGELLSCTVTPFCGGGRFKLSYRIREKSSEMAQIFPTQRVGFFRDVLGPLARGIPLGVWSIRIANGVDLDNPVEAAEGRVVFELHPLR